MKAILYSLILLLNTSLSAQEIELGWTEDSQAISRAVYHALQWEYAHEDSGAIILSEAKPTSKGKINKYRLIDSLPGAGGGGRLECELDYMKEDPTGAPIVRFRMTITMPSQKTGWECGEKSIQGVLFGILKRYYKFLEKNKLSLGPTAKYTLSETVIHLRDDRTHMMLTGEAGQYHLEMNVEKRSPAASSLAEVVDEVKEQLTSKKPESSTPIQMDNLELEKRIFQLSFDVAEEYAKEAARFRGNPRRFSSQELLSNALSQLRLEGNMVERLLSDRLLFAELQDVQPETLWVRGIFFSALKRIKR